MKYYKFIIKNNLNYYARRTNTRYGHRIASLAMVLSLDLFRKDKGGDPEIIKKSETDRYKDPRVVDKIIVLDEQWREGIFACYYEFI